MRVWRIIISASTTFIIVGGSAYGVALVASGGHLPRPTAIVACVLTGLIAAAKDTRSLTGLPPMANGSADALNQLLKSDNQPSTGPQPNNKVQNEAIEKPHE